MKDKEFEETIEHLADKAKAAEYNDLAIVLYTYLGSRKAGMSDLYAQHCQDFARSGLDTIQQTKLRRN